MRAAGALIACVVAVAGCDSGILVRGVVTDREGEPIPGAGVLVADRFADRSLRAYLRGDTEANLRKGWLTGGDGTFSVDRILGGPGKHDVWLVVRKPCFLDHAERVWAGEGGPERDYFIEVTLERDPEQALEDCEGTGGMGGATGAGGAGPL